MGRKEPHIRRLGALRSFLLHFVIYSHTIYLFGTIVAVNVTCLDYAPHIITKSPSSTATRCRNSATNKNAEYISSSTELRVGT